MAAKVLLQLSEVIVDYSTDVCRVSSSVVAFNPLPTHHLLRVHDKEEFVVLARGDVLFEPNEPFVEVLAMYDGHSLEWLYLVISQELRCEAVQNALLWEVIKLLIESSYNKFWYRDLVFDILVKLLFK